MKSRKAVFALGGAVLMGMVGVCHADTTPANTDVQSELTALRARVNELEGKQSDTWLNEQRAAEVKALVKEVLSDADTRASLADNGLTAGHDDKNFFLASEDGNYRMNISGVLQVRYIYDHRNHPETVVDVTDPDTGDVTPTVEGSDANEAGFTLNRAKIKLDGHIVNPNWLYTLQLAADRNSGTVGAEVATIGYRVMDNLVVKAGRFKAPFLHEDMVDDQYQLAVDRSVVSALFGAGYIEGAVAVWDPMDMLRLTTTIDDGSHSGDLNRTKDFYLDATDIALGARADVKIMGDWNQYDDLASWEGDETALFAGAAVRWDIAETGDSNLAPSGDSGNNSQTFAWTVDATFKMAGLNVYGAIVGSHFMADDSANGDPNPPKNIDAYGYEVQAGYMVIPDKLEPFGRFEYIRVHDADVAPTQELKVLTGGVNYYIAKHAAKFTADVVWALDPVTNFGTGADFAELGLLPDAPHNKNQVALRAQFQLLF